MVKKYRSKSWFVFIFQKRYWSPFNRDVGSTKTGNLSYNEYFVTSFIFYLEYFILLKADLHLSIYIGLICDYLFRRLIMKVENVPQFLHSATLSLDIFGQHPHKLLACLWNRQETKQFRLCHRRYQILKVKWH